MIINTEGKFKSGHHMTEVYNMFSIWLNRTDWLNKIINYKAYLIMSHSPGCHSDKLGTCSLINVREYRMGYQKWAIQRNWQQDEDKQKKNTTQYVLDTIIHKQSQITWIRHNPSSFKKSFKIPMGSSESVNWKDRQYNAQKEKG